mmetsp:Transcript_114248/g.271972  ORF Transcript_114248/g.271972 Transcript_114248/m.271972 type:complete len:205 (-) Transcript_114248:86-700(-)
MRQLEAQSAVCRATDARSAHSQTPTIASITSTTDLEPGASGRGVATKRYAPKALMSTRDIAKTSVSIGPRQPFCTQSPRAPNAKSGKLHTTHITSDDVVRKCMAYTEYPGMLPCMAAAARIDASTKRPRMAHLPCIKGRSVIAATLAWAMRRRLSSPRRRAARSEGSSPTSLGRFRTWASFSISCISSSTRRPFLSMASADSGP